MSDYNLFGNIFKKRYNTYYSDTCELNFRYIKYNKLHILLTKMEMEIGSIKVQSDSFSEIIDNQEIILKMIIEFKAKRQRAHNSIIDMIEKSINGLDILI